jgi:hypothetical protein
MPNSKMAGSGIGAFLAYTLAGPPERIRPLGFIAAMARAEVR